MFFISASKYRFRCPNCEEESKEHVDPDGNRLAKGSKVVVSPSYIPKLPGHASEETGDGDPPSAKRVKINKSIQTNAQWCQGTLVAVRTATSHVFFHDIQRVVAVPTSSLRVMGEEMKSAAAGSDFSKSKPKMGSFLSVDCLVSIVCDLQPLKKLIAESKPEAVLACSCTPALTSSAPTSPTSASSPKSNPESASSRARKVNPSIKTLRKDDAGAYPETGRVICHDGDVHFLLLRRTSRVVRCERKCLSPVSSKPGSLGEGSLRTGGNQ